MTTLTCPVWCNGEHMGEMDPLGLGWFHDSTRDRLEPAEAPGDPVYVGVSRYVNEDGTTDPDTVELRARVAGLTPAEARQLADMLYIAADMAESTSTGAQS